LVDDSGVGEGVGRVRKILFVDHTALLGGGEIALLNLVRFLDRRRYVPTVLLFQEGPLARRLREQGAQTEVMPLAGSVANARKDSLGGKSLLRMADAAVAGAFVWRVARFIRQCGADVVHTNSLKSDLIGGLAGRLAGVPVVWHVRDRIEDDYLPASVVKVFRLLCRVVPTRVIANSDATRRTIDRFRNENTSTILDGTNMKAASAGERHGREERTTVVYSGTLIEADDGVPQRASSSPASPTVGLVGRITPWKGQDVFLKAAAEVRKRFPEARFQIIGAALFDEKEYERKVHRLAAELGLEEVVEFTGFRDDVPQLIAKLDVVVHASVTGEPFGQVVIEGMAAAKPVVATDGGGIPEIVVDGETGILVAMRDHSAMAAAICSLLADPARAAEMGAAGRRRVEERFTIQRTARQVEALYDELLD
jgi:glycosyltransferase involved in cell wall biosynthesis